MALLFKISMNEKLGLPQHDKDCNTAMFKPPMSGERVLPQHDTTYKKLLVQCVARKKTQLFDLAKEKLGSSV